MVGIDLTLPSGKDLHFDRMAWGAGPWLETLDLAGAAALRVLVSGGNPTELQTAMLVVSALDERLRFDSYAHLLPALRFPSPRL